MCVDHEQVFCVFNNAQFPLSVELVYEAHAKLCRKTKTKQKPVARFSACSVCSGID